MSDRLPSYESLKIAHDADLAEVRRLRDDVERLTREVRVLERDDAGQMVLAAVRRERHDWQQRAERAEALVAQLAEALRPFYEKCDCIYGAGDPRTHAGEALATVDALGERAGRET